MLAVAGHKVVIPPGGGQKVIHLEGRGRSTKCHPICHHHGDPSTPHLLLPTCSSTTACQQRVRFLMILLGSPRMDKDLQSWLLVLPSVERKKVAEEEGQPLSKWEGGRDKAFVIPLPYLSHLCGATQTRRWTRWVRGEGRVRRDGSLCVSRGPGKHS